MDIKIPVMDGMEATKRIRLNNLKVPIIAQTAYTMTSDKDACLQAGCVAYITKPIVQAKLLCILSKYLGS